MIQRARLRPRRQEGAVTVEFVLILPILLLLIFGIIQYSYFFFQVQEGALAAREGARSSAVGEVEDIGTFVDNWVSSASGAGVSGEACYDDLDANGTLSVGDNLRVTVTFQATSFGFAFVPFPQGGQVVQVADTRVEDVEPYEVVGAGDTC